MSLLHTKGYQDVLEAVKERAMAFARARSTVAAEDIIRRLGSAVVAQVTLAHDDAEVPGCPFTPDELSDLYLTFADDVLHHYRHALEQGRSEKK